MVKKIVFLSILAVILIPSTASAQTEINTTLPTTENQRPARIQAPNSENSQTFETMQQRGMDTRAAMQEKAQAFRTQIQAIQDTRKQGIVENIVAKLTSANSRITGKMSTALDKLSTILDRVKTRAETLASSGQNVTALLTAIVEAENAIDEARTAILEQSTKEYTAEITDDLTLRNKIGTMVASFRSDITTVHQAVVAAKQAVAKTIAEAAQLQGSSNNATESANIN